MREVSAMLCHSKPQLISRPMMLLRRQCWDLSIDGPWLSQGSPEIRRYENGRSRAFGCVMAARQPSMESFMQRCWSVEPFVHLVSIFLAEKPSSGSDRGTRLHVDSPVEAYRLANYFALHPVFLHLMKQSSLTSTATADAILRRS